MSVFYLDIIKQHESNLSPEKSNVLFGIPQYINMLIVDQRFQYSYNSAICKTSPNVKHKELFFSLVYLAWFFTYSLVFVDLLFQLHIFW